MTVIGCPMACRSGGGDSNDQISMSYSRRGKKGWWRVEDDWGEVGPHDLPDDEATSVIVWPILDFLALLRLRHDDGFEQLDCRLPGPPPPPRHPSCARSKRRHGARCHRTCAPPMAYQPRPAPRHVGFKLSLLHHHRGTGSTGSP
jgi:hypothetical protein